MRDEKIEGLIRTFTSDLEALVRSELRVEVLRALEAWRSGQTRTRPRPRARVTTVATAPAEVTPVPPAPVALEAEGKRRRWTRETVVDELATWLLTGTVIEASFLSKHGKPGLVAAARKHFGRFDAALNAANVQLARLHPEGVPSANRRSRN